MSNSTMHNRGENGFLMASVIIIGTVMTILSFAIFDYANVARANLQNTIYRKLAAEAAHSGIEWAYEQVSQNALYTGTNAPTNCTNSNTSLTPYLVNDSNLCTTFKITEVADGKFSSTGIVIRKVGVTPVNAYRSQFIATISAAIQNTAVTPSGALTRIARTDASTSGASAYGDGSYTPPGTFTPNANSILVTTIAAGQNCNQDVIAPNGSTLRVSGGGLQWIPIAGSARDVGDLCDVGVRSYYAVVKTTPPSNMQVTVSHQYGSIYNYSVYVDEFDNVDLTAPIAGAVANDDAVPSNASWSLTTSATPTTNDIKVGYMVLNGQSVAQSGTTGIKTPTGWTKIHEGKPNYGAVSQGNTQGSSTSTTINFGTNTITYAPANTSYIGFIVRAATGAITPPPPTGNAGAPGVFASTTATGIREGHGLGVYNGRMYTVGGCGTNDAPTSTVQFATINANGTLSSMTQTTSLPNAVCDAGIAIANGRIYSVGGNGNANSLRYASINADGTVGAWTTQAIPAFVNLYVHSIVAYNNYLYVIGGDINYTTSNQKISYATINPTTGAVGTFTDQATWFNDTASTFCATAGVANGYLYVQGENTFRYAIINANGSIGTANLSTFPATRECASMAITSSNVYVMGGSDTTNVYYSPLNASTGAIGSWTLSTNSLPAARHSAAALSNNGYLYYTNGYLGNVEQANTWYSLIQ